VADAPCQTGRDHHLMQLALVQQVLERKRGRVESRALGDSPVSVNPSALDSDGATVTSRTCLPSVASMCPTRRFAAGL
jgi:hypothetical protein